MKKILDSLKRQWETKIKISKAQKNYNSRRSIYVSSKIQKR